MSTGPVLFVRVGEYSKGRWFSLHDKTENILESDQKGIQIKSDNLTVPLKRYTNEHRHRTRKSNDAS